MWCVKDQCHASKLQLQYSDNNLLLHQTVCNIVNYLWFVLLVFPHSCRKQNVECFSTDMGLWPLHGTL